MRTELTLEIRGEPSPSITFTHQSLAPTRAWHTPELRRNTFSSAPSHLYWESSSNPRQRSESGISLPERSKDLLVPMEAGDIWSEKPLGGHRDQMFAFRTYVNSPRGSQTGGGREGRWNPEENQSPPPYPGFGSPSPGGWLAEQPVGKDRLGPSEERLVSGEVRVQAYERQGQHPHLTLLRH